MLSGGNAEINSTINGFEECKVLISIHSLLSPYLTCGKYRLLLENESVLSLTSLCGDLKYIYCSNCGVSIRGTPNINLAKQYADNDLTSFFSMPVSRITRSG